MLSAFRILALSSLLGFSGISNAGLILTFGGSSTSSNTPATGASATVEIDFSDVGPDILLDMTVTNTTGTIPAFGAGATASKFTGFGFDLPGMTAVSTFTPGTYFDTLLAPASLPPFGSFDVGIADNNNFLGGNANAALPQGVSDSFSLLLSGASVDAAGLESIFDSGLSDGSLNFVARFQQVNAGAGSDKLQGGTCCGTPPPPTGVSEPGALGLLALGLLLLSLWIRSGGRRIFRESSQAV